MNLNVSTKKKRKRNVSHKQDPLRDITSMNFVNSVFLSIESNSLPASDFALVCSPSLQITAAFEFGSAGGLLCFRESCGLQLWPNAFELRGTAAK